MRLELVLMSPLSLFHSLQPFPDLFMLEPRYPSANLVSTNLGAAPAHLDGMGVLGSLGSRLPRLQAKKNKFQRFPSAQVAQ